MPGPVKQVALGSLDRDIADKRNAQYDYDLQDQAQAWIETVTNITFDKDFGPMLQDGVVLCDLANSILPGRIKRINRTGNLFQKQENISAFLRLCREIGVHEASLFATNTLSHLTDLSQVLTCIVAFSTAIQRNPSISYNGPVLGHRLKKPTRSTNPGPSSKKKWKTGGQSQLSLFAQGSSGTMEKTEYANAREMIKSRKLKGGDNNGISVLNNGSYGVMEKMNVKDAREMIKQKELHGGDSSSIPILNNGSRGIMDSTGSEMNAREKIKRNKW